MPERRNSQNAMFIKNRSSGPEPGKNWGRMANADKAAPVNPPAKPPKPNAPMWTHSRIVEELYDITAPYI